MKRQGRDTFPLIPELVEHSNRIETNAVLSCLAFPIKSKPSPPEGEGVRREKRQGRDTFPLIPELVEHSNRIETNAVLSCLSFPIKSKSPPPLGEG